MAAHGDRQSVGTGDGVVGSVNWDIHKDPVSKAKGLPTLILIPTKAESCTAQVVAVVFHMHEIVIYFVLFYFIGVSRLTCVSPRN